MKIIFETNKPKYIELYEKISEMINKGTLKANQKLPSKRNLAIDLNISINTVINAYNLLLDECYIYSLEKKGYYVVDQLVVATKHDEVKLKKTSEIKIKYDFTTAEVDEFTSTNWKKIIKSVLDNNEFLNRTEPLGDIGLRDEIANHLYNNRGISISKEQILIGTGLEMLESVISLLNIDNVTLENPGYHKLHEIVKNIGISTNYIPLDDQGCMIPKNKTILYTTPFNQFPTGIKMSIARKKELIKFAIDTNSYIIEDDFDAEFRINSNPTTALFSLNNQRVLFFSTFSTVLYPGLRIAYLVLPKDIIKCYCEQYNGYANPVTSILQQALKEFISQGYYASHINKKKKLYLRKRELCIKLLKENNIEFDEKRNYLSILIKPNKEIDKIIKLCNDMNIKIQSLKQFDINNYEYNTLILGYTAIKYNDLEKAVNTLIKIIEEA